MIDSDKKTEMLVGLFLFVGLLLLGGLILQFGRVREVFKDTYHLKVAFANASGIKEGSPVFLGGSRVGKVDKKPALNSTFTGVIIDIELFKDVLIPADATFGIGSAGLMGDALVEIKPSGKETDVFLPHDYDKVIEGEKAGGLNDLQSTAKAVGEKVDVVLDEVKIALKDIKEAMSKVNKGALSDTTIQNFQEGMEHLHSTLKRVDEKVLGDENALTLKTALAELKDAAASFKTASKNIEESSKKLGPMFDKLDPAIAKADKVMTTADESLQSIKKAADSFAVAAANISSSKGLLGALMNDQQMRNDFRDLIYNFKVNGPLWYKNTAEKLRAEELKKQQEAPAPPKRGIFR
ncbi:MlaD family protein [Prosthecobacter sp.]|uniref:MlaD family protein n=1 Tax=Prosthecobacter sp. TaxID=1965333 RepID=UPI002ABC9439|nr:MlaD family protein [Prosthecobacter sp.]MDZ4402147.1 MlaD family protein [Prosthecobacter sp.]